MTAPTLSPNKFTPTRTYEQLNWWFIRLRWIAAAVAFVLAYLNVRHYHYLDEETFPYLLLLIGLLVISNLAYIFFLRRRVFYTYLREIQIATDLILLTLMLHFSGGIENPLSFLYVFHIILSGILLEKR